MSENRTVNTTLMRQLVKARKFGVEHLVVESQVAQNIIRHALKGVVPEAWARARIASALHASEEELFPLCVEEQKAA